MGMYFVHLVVDFSRSLLGTVDLLPPKTLRFVESITNALLTATLMPNLTVTPTTIPTDTPTVTAAQTVILAEVATKCHSWVQA